MAPGTPRLRIAAALVIAPGLFPLGLVASGDNNWEGLAAMAIAMFAYPAMLALAVPGVLFLRDRPRASGWYFTGGAALLGVVIGFAGFDVSFSATRFLMAASFAGVGAFTGLSFWLIGFWRS